jgi:hypothetical protein
MNRFQGSPLRGFLSLLRGFAEAFGA